MKDEYLEETQEVVRLIIVTRNEIGLTEFVGEGNTLPQSPVLNGSGEEGRRADFLPQIETVASNQQGKNQTGKSAETYVERFQNFWT